MHPATTAQLTQLAEANAAAVARLDRLDQAVADTHSLRGKVDEFGTLRVDDTRRANILLGCVLALLFLVLALVPLVGFVVWKEAVR